MKSSDNGFTLIEITVVLVIIGLLIVAIVGGRGLLESAKVSNIVATAKDVAVAAKSFKEKYKYWPGDLPSASNVIPNLPAACNIAVGTAGIGNGAIDTNAEIGCAIEELFQAGLIKADLVPGAAMHTLAVDLYPARLVAGSASNVGGYGAGINVIEFANLPCSYVLNADAKLDDGDIALTSTGRARASVAACTPNVTNDPVPFFAMAIN